MREHKYLRRLKRLYDAVLDYYGGEPTSVLPEEEGLWLIWCALKKDIKECGFSPVFKIDGIRLYYYNELWKMVNGKNHDPLNTVHTSKFKKDTEVYFHEMTFDGPMERAEWLAKQPLPSYMWTEAK